DNSTLSLHDALPIFKERETGKGRAKIQGRAATRRPRVSLETTPRMQLKKAAIKEPVIVEENDADGWFPGEDEQFDLRQAVIYSRSEEHTSELQSREK